MLDSDLVTDLIEQFGLPEPLLNVHEAASMETIIKVLLLTGDQFVRLGAFVAILYFAVVLYRARIQGAPFILFGCIAVLLGEGSKVISFTGMGPKQLWLPALVATSLGYCVAAYRFAKLVRSSVKRQ